ncbi:unnamed protein product [Linum trigynum]|uniref:Uncharacterized protein n=1 Tax=Linum trigynum TaxID=586398 RepID=A0AAV2D937_9ROSI
MESDRPSVRLTSTNFALWEFQFKVFLEGKGLLGVLDGTAPSSATTAPTKEISDWRQCDARVRHYLLGSVDSSTCLSLRLFTTAHQMWRHLSATYSTVNPARQFEIRLSLARLEQGDHSITEYRSMSDVASEMVWLRRLLVDLGVTCSLPMDLFVDNTSAICIAVNPVLHDRTKHIEIHVHYVRDLVGAGTITLHHVRTEDQVADLFTKAFSTSRHWYLSNKLMLSDQHQFGGGC